MVRLVSAAKPSPITGPDKGCSDLGYLQYTHDELN